MYVPTAFHEHDRDKLVAFIERYSFATLITSGSGGGGDRGSGGGESDRDQISVSHVPLLVRRRENGLFLSGHVARANPHWRAFGAQTTAVAIFHGPHGYISPTWYATGPAVPTWNYAVVHASGRIELRDGEAHADEIVRDLTAKYEGTGASAWKPETLPEDFRRKLLGAIVAFELRVDHLEGKFKLSQNRSVEDRRGAVSHLMKDGAETLRELAAMMEIGERFGAD